jgi:hypothetical protein
MYEFAMTGTLIIVGVFLLVNLKWDMKFLGSFVTGLVRLLLGLAATRYYVEIVPLPPALQSYWLVIHVFVATLATGFFARFRPVVDAVLQTSAKAVPGKNRLGLPLVARFGAAENFATA